jgi:uncharacterized protein
MDQELPLLRKELLPLNGAPAMVIAREDLETPAGRGAVLFYHGFSVSKRTNLHELRSLARAGFVAVGVDAVGHGERRLPDFAARFGADQPSAAFFEVVAGSAAEIPGILDELIALGKCDGARVGICGVSMGGAIAFGALAREPRLQAAVCLLSSPVWRGEAASPHLQPERVFPRALLVQAAGADRTVPPEEARTFVQTLRPLYARTPERLTYLEYPGVDHLVPAPIWAQMVDRTVAWFERFLA